VDKRAAHGSKGAAVFRDPTEANRVWALFEWDAFLAQLFGAGFDVHRTPFGELPGSVVINFPTIDALCHAWDLSTSLGRRLEFPPEWIPAITGVVAATCTDAAREHDLIKSIVLLVLLRRAATTPKARSVTFPTAGAFRFDRCRCRRDTKRMSSL
jgi:hypothetical protein